MSLESNIAVECKNNVVRIISDDELFLHQKNSAQEQFAHFMGEKAISAEVINNFNSNISENSRYAVSMGKKYCHVVFPAKPIVYKDKLMKSNVKVNSLFDINYTKSNVIYPIDCLYDDSCMEKYGTHYSGKGYFNVAMKMLDSIGESFSETPVYVNKTLLKPGLARMYADYLPPCEQLFFDSITDRLSAIVSLSNTSSLPGNSGKIIFKYNPLAPRKKRVLLFGDSFFVGLLDILSNIYDEVLYLRSSFILQDVANSFNADIIFTGNAERYLVNTPSYLKGRPFFLHFISDLYQSTNLDPRFTSVINYLLKGESVKYSKWKEDALIGFFQNTKNKKNDLVKDSVQFELPDIQFRSPQTVANAAYYAGFFNVTIAVLENINNKNDEECFLMAKALNRSGFYSESLEFLMKIKNKKYSCLEFIGDIYYKSNKMQLAINYYNMAIDLNSSIYNAYYKLGVLFDALSDHDKSKRYALLAYEREPSREIVKKLMAKYN